MRSPRVIQVDAFGTRDDPRAMRGQRLEVREGMQVVLRIGSLPLTGAAGSDQGSLCHYIFRKCAGSASHQVPVILERRDLIVERSQLGAPVRGKQLLEVGTEIFFDEGAALESQRGFVPIRGQYFSVRQSR